MIRNEPETALDPGSQRTTAGGPIGPKATREAAQVVLGALVAKMRAEGLTWAAVNAGMVARATDHCPDAWLSVRGTLARQRNPGNSRVRGWLNGYMAACAAAVLTPESMRQQVDDRLDELYAQLASSDAYRAGDPKVIDACRKIEADRSRLHGLNARTEGGELASALAELVRVKARPPAGRLVVDVTPNSPSDGEGA